MVQIETEILEDHQAKLVVTVEPERVQQEMQAAARRISQQVNIPGFRRGKAPYHIIRQHFGEEAILEEALDPLGQAVYKEALEESHIEPYAPGILTDFSRDPFTMTFLVPLRPQVELGNYRDVRVPFEVQPITDEDVEKALRDLQLQNAPLEPVEHPIEAGNVALLDIVGTLVRPEGAADAEEKPAVWLNRKGVRVKIAEDATYPVPGFSAQVIGMAAGDTRSFDLSFASDDQEVAEALRGKTLHFEVRCEQVYEQKLPELNDEFARDVSEFENLNALREAIKAQLEEEAKREAHESYIEAVVKVLLDSVVTLRYPPILIEEEIDEMLEDFANRLRREGMSLEEYQRLNNFTIERLREEMREEARRRVERMLLFTKLAEAEQISVSDEEIRDEIETMSLSFGAQAGTAIRLFSEDPIRSQIASRLIAEKTVERLIQIARGEAPEIGSEAPQEEPPAEAVPEAGSSETTAGNSDAE